MSKILKILKNHLVLFNFIFSFLFFRRKKKKNAILLVFQYKEDAIRPELSSPARFRFQGGSPERDGRTKEILVSNIGF